MHPTTSMNQNAITHFYLFILHFILNLIFNRFKKGRKASHFVSLIIKL